MNEPQTFLTARGMNITAYVAALFDGIPKHEAARLAGSKGQTDAALCVTARAIEDHQDFGDAVQAVKKQRDKMGAVIMAKVVRTLANDLADPNYKCRQGAAAELRKIILGDSRGPALVDPEKQPLAGSLLDALAAAVNRSGVKATLSLEPQAQPPTDTPAAYSIQPSAVLPTDATAGAPDQPEAPEGSADDSPNIPLDAATETEPNPQ